MQFDHQRTISAPLATVWAALNDNAMLQACIPGCESLKDTGVYLGTISKQAVVVAAIGPVRAKFTGKLTLAEIIEPISYTLVFEGQGGAAGFSKGTAAVQLLAIDANSTQLSYQAKVQVGGKLTQIGSRIVDAASEKIINDFFTRFEAALNPKAPETPEQQAQAFADYLG
jgi:carbon monoxide dehydrogenase subunit G